MKVEVTDNDKHISLLCYRFNYDHINLYYTRVEVTDSYKHTNLLSNRINYSCKNLY
jgi:hypothetical protein